MTTPTTPAATDHVPFADLPPDVERAQAALDARDAAAHSEANTTLVKLVALLAEAADLAGEWLDAGHGNDCSCPYCRLIPEPDVVAFDVAGVRWATGATFGPLDCATVKTWEEFSASVERMKDERDAAGK